jgi:hypothetical protein
VHGRPLRPRARVGHLTLALDDARWYPPAAQARRGSGKRNDWREHRNSAACESVESRTNKSSAESTRARVPSCLTSASLGALERVPPLVVITRAAQLGLRDADPRHVRDENEAAWKCFWARVGRVAARRSAGRFAPARPWHANGAAFVELAGERWWAVLGVTSISEGAATHCVRFDLHLLVAVRWSVHREEVFRIAACQCNQRKREECPVSPCPHSRW